jgi:hypothetical protein
MARLSTRRFAPSQRRRSRLLTSLLSSAPFPEALLPISLPLVLPLALSLLPPLLLLLTIELLAEILVVPPVPG